MGELQVIEFSFCVMALVCRCLICRWCCALDDGAAVATCPPAVAAYTILYFGEVSYGYLSRCA